MKRVLALLALLLPNLCFAAYPERPITMIVAYSPGGGTDLVARALAPFLEKYLGGGAKVVIVNRTGAGGEIGFAALANAAPDGYTIGFVNTPPVVTIPIERKAQYSLGQLEMLGNIVDDPSNFSVHSESEVRSLKDLAAHARANPGKVTVGTTGVGSDDHLLMLMFERAAGVKMVHVPFKGAADVRTALQSRQIAVAAINIGEALQAAKGGAPMRHLGQFSPARTNLAPDVPTGREQGYPFELSSLRGLAAPRGLPADVRAALTKAIAAATADKEFQEQAVKFFAPLRYLSPTEFQGILGQQDSEFRQLWKEMPWGENK